MFDRWSVIHTVSCKYSLGSTQPSAATVPRKASWNSTHPTSIPTIPSCHSTHQTLPLIYIWILLVCTFEMIPDLADVLCVFNEREIFSHMTPLIPIMNLAHFWRNAVLVWADDNGDIGRSELSELHILITDWWLVNELHHNDFPRAPYGNSAVLTKTTLDLGSSGYYTL